MVIIGDQRVNDLPNLPAPLGMELLPSGADFSPADGKSTLSFMAIPRRSGNFTVPAFTIEVGGQKVLIPTARLVVAEPAANAETQPMRVVLDVPDRDYFVGETIQGRLLFIASADESPQYVQHIEKTSGSVLFKPARNARPSQFPFEGKQVNGLAMPVEITPLIEGDNAVNCDAMVQVQRVDPVIRRGGFPSMNTVQTPTVHLRVVALPKVGRPEGFTGAIGQFSIGQPKLSAPEVETGEPITLTFSITGNGNIDAVPPPELVETPQWRAYKPTSEYVRDEENARGTKTFSYTLVAKQDGKRSTPPLPFAYFDPVKRSYVDITIPPLSVQVKPTPGAAPADATAAKADQPAAALPPPEPDPILTGISEKPGSWTGTLGPDFRLFLCAQLVPPALLLLLWGWRRRREFLAAHPEIPLRRRTRAAARRALAQARTAAHRGDVPAFLQAGAGALCEAATRLHSARATSLTPDEVLHSLEGDAALAARAIFEHADASRYASSRSELPKPTTLLSGLERAVATLTARP